MERFFGSRLFRILLYVLMAFAMIYMFQLVTPTIEGLFGFLKAVLAPFAAAMVISYVLNPIVNALNRRKVPRTVAVLLIYATFITAVTVILMNFIPMFVLQLKELNEHLPELTAQAQNYVVMINEDRHLPDSIRSGLQNALYKMEGHISAAIAGIIERIGATISLLFVAFIVPFLAFYMLKDVKMLERAALAVVPLKHRKRTIRLLMDVDEALGNYVRGQLTVCLIVGVLAYVGYLLIGAPYPLLLASMVAVFNIIPYLGPFFGAAPAVLMASTVSFKLVLLVIVVNTTVQVLEGNVISPQIVGRTLHMHPLFIIFALLVGGEVAGIVGLILAVPFFAVLKVLFQHLIVYYNARKHT